MYHKTNLQLHGHTGVVFSITSTADGTVCSGSDDHSIRTWDLDEQTCDRVLLGHEGTVGTLTHMDSLLISGAQDGQIKVWDVRTKDACLHSLHAHNRDVNDIDVIDDHQFVSGSSDMSIKIWDIRKFSTYDANREFAGNLSYGTGENDACVKTLQSYHGTVRAIRSGKCNNQHCFFICARNGVVLAVNENGNTIIEYKGHHNDVLTCTLYENQLITGSKDKTIRVFDIETGNCEKILSDVHSGDVNVLHLYQDFIFTGSTDGTIKQLSAKTFDVNFTIERYGISVYTVHVATGNLYVGCDESVIRAFPV